MMLKKDFIALADHIIEYHKDATNPPIEGQVIAMLLRFCESRNPRFMPNRWLGYIADVCGPRGGKVRQHV